MNTLQLTPGQSPVIRLSGRTLMIARLLWLAVCGAATLTFLCALPAHWAALTHPSPVTLANLSALGLTPTFFATYVLFWEIVIVAPWVITGFLVFQRCGDERMALFTALVLVVFGVGSGTLSPTLRSLLGVSAPLDLLLHSFEFLAWYGFTLFFYLFPNGRFEPAWMRWLALLWLPIFIVWNYAPDTPLAPLNWPPYLAAPLIGLLWTSLAASQISRYRRVSTAAEHRQTRWVMLAAVMIILLMFVTTAVGALVPGYDAMRETQPTPQSFAYMLIQWPLAPAIALLPIAIAFSIMRYRLWDIDRLISRALVYGLLTTFVVLGYVLVVGGLSALLQSSGNIVISLVAAGVVAVLFSPLRTQLQRRVDRLMYGERDDPYAVLSHLSQRLETALAPEAILPAIVTTIGQTLKLPYVAIILCEDEQSRVATSSGVPETDPLVLPLTHQHEQIGELHVAPRAPDEPFTAAERRLLEAVAAQAGIAAYSVRLTNDLRRSREQIVAAREEERRRLRRDLHDGLGPRLAGQTLRLEAALDALDSETETARTLIAEMLGESQALIAEIRRLVYDLRPPALDQLGLLTAIREQAVQYQRGGLQIAMHMPDTLPPLPAAVEVAAYRIMQEALTNVARHAQARQCLVTITVGDDLALAIADDGCGLPAAVRAGVGLTSMRERAEEIGGECLVERGPHGGTSVVVRLPLAKS